MVIIMTLWIGNSAVLKFQSMAIKGISKINNSCSELLNFQNSFNSFIAPPIPLLIRIERSNSHGKRQSRGLRLYLLTNRIFCAVNVSPINPITITT